MTCKKLRVLPLPEACSLGPRVWVSKTKWSPGNKAGKPPGMGTLWKMDVRAIPGLRLLCLRSLHAHRFRNTCWSEGSNSGHQVEQVTWRKAVAQAASVSHLGHTFHGKSSQKRNLRLPKSKAAQNRHSLKELYVLRNPGNPYHTNCNEVFQSCPYAPRWSENHWLNYKHSGHTVEPQDDQVNRHTWRIWLIRWRGKIDAWLSINSHVTVHARKM